MIQVDIKALSQYLVLRFQLEGIPLTHLKLQKLLYYIQAWHLVYFEKQLFFKELPEAWVNGPVYTSVYSLYHPSTGITANTHLLGDNNISEEELREETQKQYNALKLSQEQAEFLDAVILRYGYMSAEQLVYLTHVEQPWNEAREGLKTFDKSDKPISAESMYQYYNAKIKTAANQ